MTEPRTHETDGDKQLLIGMYDVFNPNPANPTEVIGMVAVFLKVGGSSDFDNTEHWAFKSTYRGPGLNETLKVTRRTLVKPIQADWDRFLTFLRADANNIYIIADCSKRGHPVGNTLPA